MNLSTLKDLSLLAKSVDLECKLAQGQDGTGEVPKDFWSTYSAMANAHGGLVLLGVREKAGQFSVAGILNVVKVRTDLFNNLNNQAKVSVNLLADKDVTTLTLEGKTILAIKIAAATRQQKPVFLNAQPLTHTYRRLHGGDRHCDESTVRRMFAEQLDDSRDSRILNHFGLADLDLDSLHAYRNVFAMIKQNHPWIVLDDEAFLRRIGGWDSDRDTGKQGLTLAGILMFGQSYCIVEAMPLYFLDYQERSADAASQTRWLDRVVPDGSWSGNLYDFYRKVIRKLTADLKVPFVLKGDTRIDDTPLHQALREALVNTLIHADYSDRASVLVIKQPSGFVFRNPGAMRIPVQTALHGGVSDCHNRTLHHMFLLINLGEQAGSGLPKIRSGWTDEGHTLRLFDSFEPFDQTQLEMLWSDSITFQDAPIETSGKMSGKTPGKILTLIRENPAITIPELALSIGVTERSIERNLQKLQEEKLLSRIGSAKGGHWNAST